MLQLKEPLPDEEQHELAIKAKTDPRAREKLILHNLRLAYWIASKYVKIGRTEIDDLFQLAVLGLMEAIEKFKPNKGANFATVAVWYMRNSIRDNSISLMDHTSLDEPIPGTEGGKEITLKDALHDETAVLPEEEALNSAFMAEFIEEFEDKLPEMQFDAVLLQAYGHTLKDIASKHGVSPERVRQQRNRALTTIRRSSFIKELWDRVEDETKYYRDIDYRRPRVSIGGKPASPVETTVLQRERVLERLLNEVKLKGI